MIDSSKEFRSKAGIEISAESLNAVVLGADDAVVFSRSVPTTDSDNLIPQVIALAGELKNEVGGFRRLGIALPGLVDRGNGRVAFSTNIPTHTEINLVADIGNPTGLEIIIENDANSAAYAEYCCGAGRGSQNLFYATLGSGVGGAFIFSGEIWRGVAGYAGEFGYVPINSDGMRLEDVASEASIIRRTRSRFQQDSTSSLRKIDNRQLKLSEIVAAADDDDDFAQLMLERTGIYVGTVIASVINLLNIEKIIVGGEIMNAKHLVLDAIIDRAQELSFAPSFDSTSIVEGQLGVNAAAIGVAIISGQGT